MAIDSGEFRRAMSQFASGVTVVTTMDESGSTLGLTVSSFCSVSLDPPLILVCVDRRSEVHAGFQASGLFGVSVLAEDQEPVSRLFATAGSQKFLEAPLATNAQGLAFVPGALAHIECRVASAYPGGDHVIYIGEVLGLAVWPGRPLLYHRRAYGGFGSASGNESYGG